jgi:hypothetical protein
MPSDELWIELAELDLGLGDGIWDGAVPPDDAPLWSHRLGTLIAAARGPAAPDELEREAEILAGMLAATSDETDADCGPLARHRVRVLGGVAAVKAATAVVTALGAAAATTGLVVTLMAPKAGPERPPIGASTVDLPAPSDGGTSGEPSGAAGAGGDVRALDGGPADSCAVLHIDCSPTTTAGPAESSGTPDAAAASTTSPASGTAPTTAPATPPTSVAAEPSESTDAPGNSGSAPGHGVSGSTHTDPPGSSGSAPGRPESPGNSGAAPGRNGTTPSPPESPGNGGSAPGRAGSPPGRPESPGNSSSHEQGLGQAVDALLDAIAPARHP